MKLYSVKNSYSQIFPQTLIETVPVSMFALSIETLRNVYRIEPKETVNIISIDTKTIIIFFISLESPFHVVLLIISFYGQD